MRITLDHPAATTGLPVFVGQGGGEPIPYPIAIKQARQVLGLTAAELAQLLHVSPRTVNGWEQGRPPSAGPLFLLGAALDRAQASAKSE